MTFNEKCTKIKRDYKIKYEEELYQHSLRDYLITIESLGGGMDFEWKYKLVKKVSHKIYKLTHMETIKHLIILIHTPYGQNIKNF